MVIMKMVAGVVLFLVLHYLYRVITAKLNDKDKISKKK